MPNRYWAKGTKLEREDPANPGSWLPIPNRRDIGGPGQTMDLVEVTDHDSPGDYKEYIPTLKDGNEVTVPVAWDPADTVLQLLDTEFEAKTLGTYRIVLTNPAQSKINFTAYVSNMGWSHPVGNVTVRNVTLRVTGQVTVVP